MLQINEKKAKKIILGSSVISTGGGLMTNLQLKQSQEIYKTTNSITLVDIKDLNDQDRVFSAYGVGPANSRNVDLQQLYLTGLKALESKTKTKHVAFFPIETNIFSIAIELSQMLNLPILDADCTGLRAVPEIRHDNFILTGDNIFPMFAVDKNQKVYEFSDNQSPEEIDQTLRQICEETQSSIAILDHSISINKAYNSLSLGAISKALAIGEIITSSQKIQDLTNYLQPELIIPAKISNSNLFNKNGFLYGTINAKDNLGNNYTIYVKNECIYLYKNNKSFYKSPNSICILNPNQKTGIHNGDIKNNQEILIVCLKATPLWQSQKAEELFTYPLNEFTKQSI